ncbi:MAG: hypothetical protein ABI045_07470 [Flavobacteriales bacterium]
MTESYFISLLLLAGLNLNAQFPNDTQKDYIHKTSLVAQLPKELKENSGLQYSNGYFWTFNDSGGKAELYKINPSSGDILQTVKLSQAKNCDWEDIAYDGQYLYVADIGNNMQNRKNLIIYKVQVDRIDQRKKAWVPVESIRFHYPKQKVFWYTKSKATNNIDAEALFYQDGKLHLFTKEWGTYMSTHYILPTEPGNYEAVKVESFDTKGLITGADIKKNQVVMTGYTKNGLVFLWKFWDFKNGKYFNSQKKKYFLGWAPSIGQVEGVTFKDNIIYISCEYFRKNIFYKAVKQQLYRVAPLN